MATEIFTWWLVVQLMGLAALPLTRLLLGSLPDQGWAYAKTLGLLLVGYLAWLLAMLGLLPFSRVSLFIALVAVAGVGFWMTGGVQSVGAQLRELFKTRWRSILAAELLFLGALLAVVWMRAHDPTPWGTERPMDFAFFNAVQRSGIFPPNDPWLAGYSINYYYFGYVLMGAMALLSGLAPAVSYNLALALIFALTAQGVAGTIANLISLASSGERRPSRVALTLFPLLGVLMVLVAGNQAGSLQVIVGSERIVALSGSELVTALTQVAGGAEQILLPEAVQAQDFGTLTELMRQDKLTNFNWWWPSRALWDTYRDGGESRRYNITEFPLFSFRLGDMHPHVMALPFGLLAAAIALATLVRPEPTQPVRYHWLQPSLVGLAIGSLYTINSWDLPSYLLLYVGAMLLAHLPITGPYPWRSLARPLLITVTSAYLLFLPFHLTFRSLVGSAEPLIDLPILGRLTSIIAPYTAQRSGLHAFLIIFGLFVIAIVAFSYLAGQEHKQADSASSPTIPFALLPPLLLLIGLLVGFPLLALAGLGLLALVYALPLHDRPAERFGLLLTLLGSAIIFGTEIIFIRDIFGTRMNTIFKFYYQVWLLWGSLAPFALWWSLRYAAGRLRYVSWGASGATLLLLAGALVYPWLTLSELGRADTVGLAGRTPRELSAAGEASIAWLRQNVPAGSVVLEAVALDNSDAVTAGSETPRCGGSYNGAGYAGIAAATGLPTLLGWDGHQRQWRGGDPDAMAELGPRCSDVDTIYRTRDADRARELLTRYGVDYVYVGNLEQQYYELEALTKFVILGEVVFSADEVTIYRLNQASE